MRTHREVEDRVNGDDDPRGVELRSPSTDKGTVDS